MPHTAAHTNTSCQAPPSAMLRWVFERRAAMITCEVDFTPEEGYDVSVVPHWDVAATAIEHFDSPLSALERHAELACTLRDTGWTMVGSVTRWPGPEATA